MKPYIFTISLSAALFLAPVPSRAQGQDTQDNVTAPNRQGPDRVRAPRASRTGLDLTDAQRAELRKNAEASRRERLIKNTDLQVARLDLRSLLRAENVDEGAIAAKLADAQAAQGALLKIRVDSAVAMRKILTPEQQKRITSMRGDRVNNRTRRRLRAPGDRGLNRSRRGLTSAPRSDVPGEGIR